METQEEVTISALLARCASAPPEAADWRQLVARLTPPLRGVIVGSLYARRAHRGELVEDLVQEVWCRLLAGERRALRDYRGRCDREAAAYLRRIATSIVLDRLRSDAASKRLPEPLGGLDASEATGALLADRRSCPERRLLAREQALQLAALCCELIGNPRRAERLTVARLALVEGRSSREIVDEVGRPWSVSRVNSFLFRLRRRLAARGVRVAARAREVAA